ncbi:MAG: amino acid transporter [Candidatus Obscuribacterales bacterium]
MCLTGVDYFSTLGYQPGIAFLAAGILSPIATALVIVVTLFGLVPLYSRVARESPHGQGSIAMLERLLPGWKGKTLILVLLGFAATDFVMTITLSAADATAHVVENPLTPPLIHDRIAVTLVMLAVLGAVFMKGFREAISLAVLIVILYLLGNAVIVARSVQEIISHPELLSNWTGALFQDYGSPWKMLAVSAILFPKLALGMSGFETGVAVMPLVRGNPDDDLAKPEGKIRNTARLLLCAALIMAGLLITSAVVTTVLIPPELFKPGAPADGRALSYLGHRFLGEGFGTYYDLCTILILWFAGASAMTGLLNLVPRYLPRYGMAPEWSRAHRPLAVFFTLVSFAVTIIFRADVDAQAGAYATGVLVLFTSAALGVVLASWKEGWKSRITFIAVLLVFVYTTIANMIERPEGLHIASFFIATVLTVSLISRAVRSVELRIRRVILDPTAEKIVDETLGNMGQICLLARRPGGTEYSDKEKETRALHKLTRDEARFIFLEVGLSDPSEFQEDTLHVTGHYQSGVKVLRCQSPAIPNAIAAILFHLRDKSGTIPHAYFGWTEGHPLSYVFRYIFFGEGEIAPVTREILRNEESDPEKRPRVLVG